MQWLSDKIVRHPAVVIVLFLAATGLLALRLPSLQAFYSIRALYDYKGNKELAVLDRYLEEFGDDGGFIGAVLKSDKVFSPPVLRYIQELTRALEHQPEFWRVHSLAVSSVPRGQGDEVVTGKLFEEVPTTEHELEGIRQIAASSNLVVPRILSRDGRYTIVAAEMRIPSAKATLDEQSKAVQAFRGALAGLKAPEGVEVKTAGRPIIETELREVLIHDQILFSTLAAVLVVAVLLLVFGQLHGLLVPLSGVLLAVGWTLGLMAWFGAEINLFSCVLPTIIFVYGLVNSIFLLNGVYFHIGRGRTQREAAKAAALDLWYPCLLTSGTTAIGFGSIAVTALPLLQRFGIFLAAGVVVADLMSLVWLPALVCIAPIPKAGLTRRPITSVLATLMGWLPVQVMRHRRAILLVCLALTALGIVIALTRNKVSVYHLKELPQDKESVQSTLLLDSVLGGEMPTAVVVRGPVGTFADPEAIRAIARLDRWIKGVKIVRSSMALSELVASTHQAFNGGDPKYHRVPSSRALVSQYLAMMDPRTRTEFVRDDYSMTHIRILTENLGSYEWKQFFKELQVRAGKELSRFNVTYTGYALVACISLERLAVECVWGYLYAFGSIAIMLMIAWRSIRLGLMACPANMMAGVACLAMMPFFGVTIRQSTVLFLSVSIGMVFDNTIFLFSKAGELWHEGRDAAVRGALRTVGPPAIYTASLIALSFGIFAASDFGVLKIFGLSCVAVVVIGLMADLVLSPAVLHWGGDRVFLGRRGSPPSP